MKLYIIGSLTQSDKIEIVANYYKMFGHIVDYPKREANKSFDKIVDDCFSQINLADKIVVVRKEDGTLGEGSTYEVAFAKFLGKDIEFVHDPYPIDRIIKEAERN